MGSPQAAVEDNATINGSNVEHFRRVFLISFNLIKKQVGLTPTPELSAARSNSRDHCPVAVTVGTLELLVGRLRMRTFQRQEMRLHFQKTRLFRPPRR